MCRQTQISFEDFSQLLKQTGIDQFYYSADSSQYQFLLYLGPKILATAVCRGTLQFLPAGYQLRIQPDAWRGRTAELDALQRLNESLRQALRYPPQFCQADDGVWLQSSLAPGARLAYRFSTALLLMLRIIREQALPFQ